MTVGELIEDLKKWDSSDEVRVNGRNIHIIIMGSNFVNIASTFDFGDEFEEALNDLKYKVEDIIDTANYLADDINGLKEFAHD